MAFVAPFLVLALFVVLILIAWRPHVCALFIWPVLLLYPHGAQERLGMPMNIGLDDIFILLATALVLFRLTPRHGLRLTVAFKIAVAAFIINLMANVFGLISVGPIPGLLTAQSREVLKMGIFLCLVVVTLESLETTEDCWRLVRWLAMSIYASGIVLIASWHIPAMYHTFGVPGQVYIDRAFGALCSPNTAAMVMVCGLCLCTALIERAHGNLRKAFYVHVAAVMVVAVLYTGSRTGFLAVATIPPVLLFMRGMRKWAIVFFFGGVLVYLLAPPLMEQSLSRLGHVFTGTGMTAEAASRFPIWMAYLRSMNVSRALLGQGHPVAEARVMMGIGYPHNGFLNLFCYWGIWGIVWMVAMVTAAFWLLRKLRDHGFPEGLIWRKAMYLFMVVSLVEAMTTDHFQPGGFGFMLTLPFLALTDRFEAAYREEAWAYYESGYYDYDYDEQEAYERGQVARA